MMDLSWRDQWPLSSLTGFVIAKDSALKQSRTIVSAIIACLFLVLVACGDESSSSPSNPGNTDGLNSSAGPSDSSNAEPVCGFKKSDNVWKFSYSTGNISEEYTWVDESTVVFEEYMNANHMDEDDSTYTDVNRDEFFDRVMERCLNMNDLLEESSSSVARSSSSVVTQQSSSCETSVSSSSVYVDPSTVVKGSMTDERDGQTYRTVTIGTQTWMAENLNYAYTGVPFIYGDNISDSTSWCYENSRSKCTEYGRLYTWAAAMDSMGTWSSGGRGCGYSETRTCSPTYPVRGICPEGWHLPDSTEWSTLFAAVGGKKTAGDMLKSIAGWTPSLYSNGYGTNAYLFSALAAGYRISDRDFTEECGEANFWSSTESHSRNAYYISLTRRGDSAYLGDSDKIYGYSVRCLKD